MATKTVQALLDDIRLLGNEQHALVESVRALVRKAIPSVSEQVKYGGIVFAADVPFCGVFAYRQHVSVEFGCGSGIADTLGHLEGSGKGRRHIKLYCANDLETRHLAHYLPLALAAARGRT